MTLETRPLPDLEASPDATGIHPWVVAWVTERSRAVPLPGAGQTWTRLATLADVAGHDLSAARLVEGHLDALAILAELGHPPTGTGLYGVWAAHRPGELVAAPAAGGWSLTGTKPFCSGAGLLSRALVVADSPEGPRLFDLDVSGVDVADGTWPAVGMAGSKSLQVRWSGERIRPGQAVGEAGAYTQRIGFWWGAVGVAACWWGGARELLRVVAAQLRNGSASEVQLADLGAAWADSTASESSLRSAAEVIDHGDDVDAARRSALLTRQIVHDAAIDIIALTSSAGGARPLCLDPAQSRRAADLPAYLAQHHRGRDNVALGRLLTGRA